MSFKRSSAMVGVVALLAACSPHGSQSIVPAAGAPNRVAPATMARASQVPYGPVRLQYTGKPQTYVVPEGVTSLSVTAYGAKSNDNFAGITQATIPVTPGETLTVNVGGDGAGPDDAKRAGGAGGYNGGANGAYGRCCFQRGAGGAWGGGGATTVAHADGRWAVIAGGAGGSSSGGGAGGGGGGVSGQDASHPQYSSGGQGGTQSCDHSQIGSGTSGGATVNSAYGGGGGGGGYCGGAGGSGSGSHGYYGDTGETGGGGGSGYYEPDAKSATTGTQTSVNFHEPSVSIIPPPKVFTVVSGLNRPWGVAVDPEGNVYVADTGNAVVKKFSAGGSLLKTYTGFKRPEGVAVDASGNVYVADFKGETLTKIQPNGTTSNEGSKNRGYEGVAVVNGQVYVTDRGYSSIRSAFYWELYVLGAASDTYWDWSTGNTPHEIAAQNNCKINCSVYAAMETFQGAGKSTGNATWAFQADGTSSTVANIDVVPDAGVAYNGVTLWVASQHSHAVCGLVNGKCAHIGGYWQSPMGLAVTPNCSKLCALYVVDQEQGVVKKIYPLP